MSRDADGEPPSPDAPISVPELRDYHQINAEVRRRLDRGATHVRLDGPAGHRLLLAGLAGPWRAVVEIAGDAGPELAAGMDAPALTVVCGGSSADGAGSGVRAGTLVLVGPSGGAVGYRLAGGLIVAGSDVGPRAGLGMADGGLVLFGRAGPLAGERQSGGSLFLAGPDVGRNAGRDAQGGRRYRLDASPANGDDRRILALAMELRARYAFAAPAAE